MKCGGHIGSDHPTIATVSWAQFQFCWLMGTTKPIDQFKIGEHVTTLAIDDPTIGPDLFGIPGNMLSDLQSAIVPALVEI